MLDAGSEFGNPGLQRMVVQGPGRISPASKEAIARLAEYWDVEIAAQRVTKDESVGTQGIAPGPREVSQISSMAGSR